MNLTNSMTQFSVRPEEYHRAIHAVCPNASVHLVGDPLSKPSPALCNAAGGTGDGAGPGAQLDNILLQGDAPAVLKLCDFGYSKDGNLESDCKTACGTPEYMAPEVLGPPPATAAAPSPVCTRSPRPPSEACMDRSTRPSGAAFAHRCAALADPACMRAAKCRTGWVGGPFGEWRVARRWWRGVRGRRC